MSSSLLVVSLFNIKIILHVSLQKRKRKNFDNANTGKHSLFFHIQALKTVVAIKLHFLRGFG